MVDATFLALSVLTIGSAIAALEYWMEQTDRFGFR